MEQIKRQCLAEKVTTQYMKQIYSFTLKKTATLQDAEDLTQEICLKLFKALTVKDDIEAIEKFVWTVVHNALANYYRGKSRNWVGNIDDLKEALISDKPLPEEKFLETDMLDRLHKEIAYLSNIQRRIVILYYYSNKKQSEIAQLLGLPLGTVKWHLSEARNELKKGIDTVKNIGELKFNPIKFDLIGLSGSVGTTGGTANFFRSRLSQNVAYCVYREAKSVNEIADCLGVSPVYVESEAEFLEEYGFLIKQGDKYLANLLIDDSTSEQNLLQSRMYEKAAKLIANDLYDELIQSDLLDVSGLYYPDQDRNFLMWSLLFYILAYSGEKLMENGISFAEAATIRRDGGVNIAYASIQKDDVTPTRYCENIKRWFGPCWNSTEKTTLWLINSEWSNREMDFDNYARYIDRDLNLLGRFVSGDSLSEEDYAFMAKKGYIKKRNNDFELAIVHICDTATRQKLIKVGDIVKEKYHNELKVLKDEYTKLVLDNTPKHLRKMQSYGLQYIFYADGWFLLYCAKELVGNGKLKMPTDKQRQSLTMLMLSE